MMSYKHRLILFNFKKFYQNLLKTWIHSSTNHVTAGIIIVGNEILNARVKDTNSHYACGLLYKCGIKVKKISVINDDIEDIKQEIKTFSDKYTYVITAGGIGPTHDDVTYEGLAKAFNDSLHYHPKLVDIIKNQFAINSPTSPSYKMAYIPTKSSLIFGRGNNIKFPCITLQNVYVFPGSPEYFRKSFGHLYKELFSTNRYFVKDEIYLNAKEETFANILTVLAKEFPNVTFGSYPVSDNSYYKAFITIESDSIEETKKAKQKLCDLIGPKILVEYDNNPHVDSLTKYKNFLEKCQRKLIYEETLEVFTNTYHQPEKVVAYFDSSIESFIVVHFAHLARTLLCLDCKLEVFCLQSTEFYQNIKELIPDIIERYNITVSILESDIPHALNELKLTKPQIETLLVGTERMKFSEVTTQMKVIYPLDKWTKEDINVFARFLCLPLR